MVATENDAAYGEDICKEEKKPEKKPKKEDLPEPKPDGKEKKDILPEFRTISMTDRSGGPLDPVLEDGEPFKLEWIDPAKHMNKEKLDSVFSRIPGGAGGAALIALVIAMLIGIIYVKNKGER